MLPDASSHSPEGAITNQAQVKTQRYFETAANCLIASDIMRTRAASSLDGAATPSEHWRSFRSHSSFGDHATRP
jgi:hypothetical protein